MDPDEPSILAGELREGGDVEVGPVSGDQTLEETAPFPVTVVPYRLARRGG